MLPTSCSGAPERSKDRRYSITLSMRIATLARAEPWACPHPHQLALVPWIVQIGSTLPGLMAPGSCVAPFISQTAVLPEVSRQSRSLMPSALKSPVSTIVQVVGTKPGEAPEVGIVPFMKYIARPAAIAAALKGQVHGCTRPSLSGQKRKRMNAERRM